MKKVLVIGLIIMASFVGVTGVAADEIITESYYYSPVIIMFNLTVDGSITPVVFTVTADDNNIDYVMQVISHMRWQSNTIDYNDFGTGSALENGSQMIYDGIELVNVKNIHDMGLSTELRIDRDDKNPKDNHLVNILSFVDFVSPKGLKIKNGHNLTFVVRDDLISRIDDLSIIVEGFKLIQKDIDFQAGFTDEMLIIDDIWKLIFFPLFIPLTLVFTWEPVLTIIGTGILLIELLMIRWIVIRRN